VGGPIAQQRLGLPLHWRERSPHPADYYVAHVTKLGRANGEGWAQGLCPFHDDHHASLSVHLDVARGLFRCLTYDARGDQTAQDLMRHLLVADLDDPGVEAARALATVPDGAPMPSGTVAAIIEAVRPLLDGPVPPGLLVFETASTLSEAEETNVGFRVLIQALRRIARALQLPVVLSHHVSQASLANLADLNLSTADIRGGTALVNNARQTALLVNLGSAGDPFPDTDARTLLRRLACPAVADRVTALVCLDSSKGVTPPPMFFRWDTRGKSVAVYQLAGLD
jgi:hypothetical protein